MGTVAEEEVGWRHRGTEREGSEGKGAKQWPSGGGPVSL